MHPNNVATARLLGSVAALAVLAVGGVSLSTRANASPLGHGPDNHGSKAHSVGQQATTSTNHSPTNVKGFQNSAPTSSGGQNSIMNAFCRKAPCHISQKLRMPPNLNNVSAFIVLGPSDYLVVP